MKNTRNNLFETNSSSLHTITYCSDNEIELDKNLIIELKYFDNDEYTSVSDKLALLCIALIWKCDFENVYGYLNGYRVYVIKEQLELLKNLKTVLEHYGVEKVEFKWDSDERFGCSCDDEIMDELESIYKSVNDIEDYLKHQAVYIFDRDDYYRDRGY